jgi:puromycin-sensitive aminopeptidase
LKDLAAKSPKAAEKPAKSASTPKAAAKPRPSARKSAAAKEKAAAKVKPAAVTDAAFRLSRDVIPSHYHVHVLPDLVRGTFRGEVAIDLELKRQTPSIELHAADLVIDHAELIRLAPDGKRPPAPQRKFGVAAPDPLAPQPAVAMVPHGARETVEVKFLRPISPGKVTLCIAYHGTFQKRLRGLYAAQAAGQPYIFTQLEAADARRFFPCFDEPDLKANFTFSVTARSDLTVLSNNTLRRADRNSNGTTTSHFKATPKLSTYLCALAVGELEGSRERLVGKVPIRVWHVPGKAHLAGFALEAAAQSLHRLEKYFGIPYPYEKLDLVAVPDFEAGAMENVGAVFFRETLLLVDPKTISLAEKKRVAEVIAHELAHMWFGNLVTMKWWDDLWLNEAFATWMAFRIVDEWKPEWRMWNNFEPHRAMALSLDALTNTHPIYADVKNAAQATENFDAITYEKGAAVVRMLEQYLGAKPFRAGVQAYIKKHRESNAVAADLWKALEKASGEPVAQIAKAWIEQPGFPLVTVERGEREQAGELHVKQQRFLASPTTRVAGGEPLVWPVPLVFKLPGRTGTAARTHRSLLRKARDKVAIPGGKAPPWYYGNAGESGFYRVAHDPETLSKLAAEPTESLEPVERMGLLGNQWAIVRAGRAPIGSFMDLVAAFGSEPDHEVLEALAGPLSFVDDQLADAAGPETRAEFQEWLWSTFGSSWGKVGWEVRRGENEGHRLRRAALLRLVGVIGEDPAIATAAADRFKRYLSDRSAIEPNLADALVAIVARDGDLPLFERIREAVTRAATPQERRRFQLALGDFRDPAASSQARDLCLTTEVPTQDVGFLLIRLLGNRSAREKTWDFIQEHWPEISKRLPPLMASRLIEATAALQSRELRKQVSIFFRTHPVETGARALRLALERFDVNEELRRRAGRDLRNWFNARSNTPS